MKKLALSVLMVCTIAASTQAQKIKGSDTVLPLAQKEAESFMKKTRGSVTVVGGGSGVGIAALLDGTTEIAMSSRKMKFDEKVKCQEAGKAISEKIIAYDALAVVVNPGNPVSKLTRAQLESKIYPWGEEVESNALEVHVHHLRRKTSSDIIKTVRGVGYLIPR